MYVYIYLSISLSLYIYIYIYINVSCFRAGGVHIVQALLDRIPHTRNQFGPGVRDQLPRVLS